MALGYQYTVCLWLLSSWTRDDNKVLGIYDSLR